MNELYKYFVKRVVHVSKLQASVKDDTARQKPTLKI